MTEKKSRRIARETKTITAMLSLYCRHHHKSDDPGICKQCKEIQDYAIKRLHNCPFIEIKPTCANCLVHCYKKDIRDKVRQVMRYSGPRLLFTHPILALCHILDGRIKPQPIKNAKNNSGQQLNEKSDGNLL